MYHWTSGGLRVSVKVLDDSLNSGKIEPFLRRLHGIDLEEASLGIWIASYVVRTGMVELPTVAEASLL